MLGSKTDIFSSEVGKMKTYFSPDELVRCPCGYLVYSRAVGSARRKVAPSRGGLAVAECLIHGQ